MIDVAANVAAVKKRIALGAERAGRDPASIVLIAAAKKKPAAMVDAAIAAGVTDIGENYVQEAVAKQALVTRPARWHMIGHLQRNKAKRAVEMFDLIQSVDNIELGRALGAQAEARQRPVRVLIEVNLGGELTKSGVEPAKLAGLTASLRAVPYLTVEGLMTMPPPGPLESSRPFFCRLRALRDELGLKELSMGMTADFEVAVEEGATMVRVGTAIFGERE
jgi:PLP dependent protein